MIQLAQLGVINSKKEASSCWYATASWLTSQITLWKFLGTVALELPYHKVQDIAFWVEYLQREPMNKRTVYWASVTISPTICKAPQSCMNENPGMFKKVMLSLNIIFSHQTFFLAFSNKREESHFHHGHNSWSCQPHGGPWALNTNCIFIIVSQEKLCSAILVTQMWRILVGAIGGWSITSSAVWHDGIASRRSAACSTNKNEQWWCDMGFKFLYTQFTIYLYWHADNMLFF